MKSKSELLVFLEFVDEAEVFLKEYGNALRSERNNITIISFHPLVKSYLLKQQIKVMDSFHFCPTESYRKLLCVLEDTLSDIRMQCSITDENGVTHAYVENLIFRLRAIISHILYRIEVITNALSIYQSKDLLSVGSLKPFAARSMIYNLIHKCFSGNIIYNSSKDSTLPFKHAKYLTCRKTN